MDLWIRSQDKETLIKINRLDVDRNKIQANFKSHFSGCDYVILGTYESNDRALEVLDEIQDRMLKSSFVKKTNGFGDELDIIPNNLLIYEMPKE